MREMKMRAASRSFNQADINRRSFLRTSSVAAGGLFVSLYLNLPAFALEEIQAPAAKVYPPDAFVHVKPDGKILITVNRLEFGQGVQTSLPMVLADEMDADWSQVVPELAPAADVYRDPVFGIQMVGGSGSIAHSFTQYRELGAKARAMLVAAAADRWKVSPDQCRTENSVVYGPNGKSARYAELARDAARKPVPAKVSLKSPSEFRLIGKKMPRLDSGAKCDGSQKFGLDLDLPGMKIAVVAHPPVFGARVKAIDDKEARSIVGVKDVFEISLVKGSGVAVVADRFWTAKQARDSLKIDWDLSGVELADTTQLWTKYKALAHTPGNVAVARGDDKAIDRIPAARRIVADYEFPYLAHSPMEPLNATVRFEGNKAEAWVPSQFQTMDQMAIAEVLGLKPEEVTFHTEFAGGGFGRRAVIDSHVPREAAAIAKRLKGTPVKLVWTREDDVRGGYYRPMHAHRVEIGIGADGMPAAWRHVIVGQSLVVGTPFAAMMIKNGVDESTVEGTSDTNYNLTNFHVSAHNPTVNIPVLWWRSVGNTHTAFVMETLIDELAQAAGKDPIEYRLAVLDPKSTRQRAVLELVRRRSGWNEKPPAGRARGVAMHTSFGSAVAEVAEVSVDKGRIRVH